MVFEVINAQPPAVSTEPAPCATRLPAGPDAGPGPAVGVRRSIPAAVIAQLLRSAVALQAEGLLRTAGALAGSWGGVFDRTEWIERDARDLGELTAVAMAAGVRLPAGVDSGVGDPEHPSTVVEGLLAGHEALVRVLRQLVGPEPDAAAGPGAAAGSGAAAGPGAGGLPDGAGNAAEPWLRVVRAILDRREEEMVMLRAMGAQGRLPCEQRYLRGRPPRP